MPVLAAPGFETGAFAAAAGRAAQGFYIFSPALPTDEWPAAGQEFAAAFRVQAGSAPDPEALYGYAAATSLLEAMEAVCADGLNPASRRLVLNATVAALRRQDLVLPDEFAVYRVTGGKLDFLEKVRAGE
jgi:hypothetical protein